MSPESFIPMEEFLQSIGDYSNENQSFLNNEAQTMEISSNQDSYNDEEDNKKDSDRDGIPDCIEEYIGTDLNNQDTDGDGYLDLEEIKNGYNPLGEGKVDQDFLELLYTSPDIYNKK